MTDDKKEFLQWAAQFDEPLDLDGAYQEHLASLHTHERSNMFKEISELISPMQKAGYDAKNIEISAIFAVYHELLQQVISNDDIAMPTDLREAISTSIVLGRLIILGPNAVSVSEADKVGYIKPKDFPF